MGYVILGFGVPTASVGAKDEGARGTRGMITIYSG